LHLVKVANLPLQELDIVAGNVWIERTKHYRRRGVDGMDGVLA
jgi:hypothetical protein